MDLLTAIDTRASAPKLDAPAPTAEHLERILLAGVRAPDHGKIAPWRFVVLNESSRSILGEAMAGLMKRNNPEASEASLDIERAKALRAPTIVVVAARVNRAHKVPEIEQVMAVAAGVQNMILTAHSLGYGTMWKTGGAAYDAEVKTTLGLEPDDHIVAFLYLGKPIFEAKPRAATLEGVVRRL